MRNARLALIGAAALFSTGGAAIKACSLGSWHVAGLRSLVAGLFLVVCIPAARRGLTWRALPVAATYAATLTLFVSANKLTTAANAIFLQSTAPLYVLLLAPWLLKERVRRGELVFMVAVAFGLALVLASADEPRATAPDPGRGDLLGLSAGLVWAFTVVGLRAHGSQRASGGLAPVVLGNFLAAAVCLPLGGALPAMPPVDGAVILYLGAIQIGLAYLLLTRGLESVPALEASLLLLAEPALAPIWAWAIHGETPTLLAGAGGLLILGASAVRARSRTSARATT